MFLSIVLKMSLKFNILQPKVDVTAYHLTLSKSKIGLYSFVHKIFRCLYSETKKLNGIYHFLIKAKDISQSAIKIDIIR